MKYGDHLLERKDKEKETWKICIDLVKEKLDTRPLTEETNWLDSFNKLVENLVDSNLQRKQEIQQLRGANKKMKQDLA
jgi:hypothetical protein